MKTYRTKTFFHLELDDKKLSFAHTEYSGKVGAFVPAQFGPDFCEFITFLTKKEAIKYAKNTLHWPANSVEKIGNRFNVAWGIRHDIRDNYFLLKQDKTQ